MAADKPPKRHGQFNAKRPPLKKGGRFVARLDPDDAQERDEIRLNRHRALESCLSMIFSENRFTLFRIML
jgi:hypothetical protein